MPKIKISEVIAKFLVEQSAQIYTVSGGANLHILDSLSRNNVKFICTQTEQGASFAADAASRLGKLGVSVVTSGPGATNCVTGIASSYYDSVPTLTITGQQSRSRLDTQGCRQIGFQQTPIVPMVSHITKYAVTVMEPEDILFELQKAVWISREGRPGPVVVDIPDDLQRLEIEPEKLRHFKPDIRGNINEAFDLKALTDDVLQDLHRAKRPLIIYGWGIRLAKAERLARDFAKVMGIPVAATWAVRDAFPEALCFGTHGTKAGNMAVQNADYILSIGSRLDTKATSSPVSLFAPNAKLSMVDIDPAELAKMGRFGRPLYRAIPYDCKDFLGSLEGWARATIQHEGSWPDWSDWREDILVWQTLYKPHDVTPPRHYFGPYDILNRLGEMLTGDEIIVSDTGNTLAWTMQGFQFKGQQFLHPFNNTPMGYALPAALAASLATGKRVICLTGDGSIMMALSELATISKHCRDVKVMLLNNLGHSMCRYTQKQWLGGTFAGTWGATGQGDLAFPRSFAGVVRNCGDWIAYGQDQVEILGIEKALWHWGEGRGLSFIELMTDPNAGLSYQVRYGKSLEDGDMPLKEAA